VGTYVVLSRVNAEGLRTIKKNPGRFDEIRREVEAMDGKIVSQFALLGEYDFLTVVSAPDNHVAHQMAVERTSQGRSRLMVLPAIDLSLFVRLLGQTTETTGPYRWQIRFPAQVVRRALRWYTVTRHVRAACKPLTIDGQEHFKGLKGPTIFIANHSSHLDSIVLLQALPERYRRRLAFGGAADRWFLKGLKGIQKQGWWNSLAMNTFPIKRGGGSSSLDYAKWLIDKKWSIMIFPEGTRSSTGKMGHFRHGVSILALEKNVPVVPIYMEGLRNIRPKGSQSINPGPVHVKVGQPIRFEPGTTVPEATRMLYHAMEGLRKEVHRPRSRAAQEAPAGTVEAPAEAGG
jgi:1-acyl-sn-glycerol-3-phosphate acyltransferase